MTFFSDSRPARGDIIGPYSSWPRRPRMARRAQIVTAATVVAAAAFVHCVVPML